MRGVKGTPLYSSCVSVRCLSLSSASEALDTSSRRKISGCEYREWMMRCSSWLTSAWKLCFVAMGVIRIRKYKNAGAAAKRGTWSVDPRVGASAGPAWTRTGGGRPASGSILSA